MIMLEFLLLAVIALLIVFYIVVKFDGGKKDE